MESDVTAMMLRDMLEKMRNKYGVIKKMEVKTEEAPYYMCRVVTEQGWEIYELLCVN